MTPRRSRWLVTPAAAVLLALAAGPAAAAVPPKNSEFSGRTSQGTRITIAIDEDGEIDNAEATIRVTCAPGGVVSVDAFAVVVPITTTGRFTDLDYESGLFDFDRLTHGQTTALDVTKATLTGRFSSRSAASGTWRLQTMLLSPGTFPYDPSLVGSCDSGIVSWSVRASRARR